MIVVVRTQQLKALLLTQHMQEDIRQFGFQSFDGDEQRLKPTQAQRDIMGDLVRGMDLTKRAPLHHTPAA